jgi:hypothetical protein
MPDGGVLKRRELANGRNTYPRLRAKNILG